MEYQILEPGKPGYPTRLTERLGDKAPQRIYANGPLGSLDRFTLAVACADSITGLGFNATNQLLFTIREYDLNYVGGWHSVMETEIFRLGLYRSNSTVTLFTAKGLAHETYESFLRDRFYPPLDEFPERDEYFRRAKDGELLVLSAVDPSTSRTVRQNVVERNLAACALANAVFIPYGPKGSKTHRLAAAVAEAGWPCFTLEHELAADLHALGVAGYSRATVGGFLNDLGARIAGPGARPSDPEPDTRHQKTGPASTRLRPSIQQEIPFASDAKQEGLPND